MSDDAQDGFLPLNNEASAAAIVGLCAALQLVTEFAIFPDRIKVDDKSPNARLDYVNKEVVRCVKTLFSEGMSEIDERDGIRTALNLIAGNAAAIRRHF